MNSLRCPGALSLATTALLLVGCSGPTAQSGIPTVLHNDHAPDRSAFVTDQIEALSQPRSEKDQLPGAFATNGTVPVIENSIRFLADHDEVRYYVGLGTDPDADICLLVYRSDDLWGAYCSDSLPFEASMAGGTIRAQLIDPGGTPVMGDAGTPLSEDWHQVTENLIVEK
jgi:hypothetical protein